MKKIAVLFGVMMMFLFSACGSSGDNSALDANEEEGTADFVVAEPDAPELSIDIDQEEVSVAEPAVPEPTLDEVIEDVLNYAESEGMVVADSIKDIIEEMYYVEGPDALNIFNKLCDAGEIAFAPIMPEGIIVLSYTYPVYSSYYIWKSTGTFKCTTFTINLDCINPDTGEVQHLRTFSSEDTHSCSLAKNGLGRNAVLSRMHFNSDFTQLTATLTLEDGSVHVGWIDESGKFTDVSAKITVDADDFSALTNHTNPCFGPGGYFYFRDATKSDVQDKRVPLDNLTASAVETVVDDVNTWWNEILNPLPDGTIGNKNIENAWYYYDESMEYPASGLYFDDWISPFECAGIDDNMIYKYTLSGDDYSYMNSDWYSDRTELIPDIEGRKNMAPVVSPDGTKVAFLSVLTTGTDESPYLYTVPVDGGNPVKVSTDYIFAGRGIDAGLSKKIDDETYWNTTILLTWE